MCVCGGGGGGGGGGVIQVIGYTVSYKLRGCTVTAYTAAGLHSYWAGLHSYRATHAVCGAAQLLSYKVTGLHSYTGLYSYGIYRACMGYNNIILEEKLLWS